MKWTVVWVSLLYTVPSHGEEGSWNFLQISSKYRDAEWEIYRAGGVAMSLTSGTFAVPAFEGRSGDRSVVYQVRGTIKKSSDIYGDDVVATFVPLETEGGPQTCKGKYLRYDGGGKVVEEMNFLCNGSADFRSFKRITEKKP